MELEQAIRISKILCQADEGRIPLILNTLEKAGIVINGMEELEEWKALSNPGYLVDVEEFIEGLCENFTGEGEKLNIPVQQFNDFCKERKLKPLLTKKLLARSGFLTPVFEGEKRVYTTTVWLNNAPTRCVAVWKTRQKPAQGV